MLLYAIGEIDFLQNGKVQFLLIYETFLQEFTSLDMSYRNHLHLVLLSHVHV